MTVIITALFRCPECHRFHVDAGIWWTRPHKTHLCLFCGHLFDVMGLDYCLRGRAPTRWERFVFALPHWRWLMALLLRRTIDSY